MQMHSFQRPTGFANIQDYKICRFVGTYRKLCTNGAFFNKPTRCELNKIILTEIVTIFRNTRHKLIYIKPVESEFIIRKVIEVRK